MASRQRLKKLIITTGGLLASGLAYAFFVLKTGLAVPCVFRLITGLKCPGCGVSRMCLALLRLDIHAAWAANPVLLAMLPVGAILAVRMAARYVGTGDTRATKGENAVMAAMVAVLLVFGVVRNIW